MTSEIAQFQFLFKYTPFTYNKKLWELYTRYSSMIDLNIRIITTAKYKFVYIL